MAQSEQRFIRQLKHTIGLPTLGIGYAQTVSSKTGFPVSQMEKEANKAFKEAKKQADHDNDGIWFPV
jgi:hypothetical protein